MSPTPGESAMPDIARRCTRSLALHRYDVLLDPIEQVSAPQPAGAGNPGA